MRMSGRNGTGNKWNERKRLANVQMEQNEWALKFCTHLAACACCYQQHHQQAQKLQILHCTRIIICYKVTTL